MKLTILPSAQMDLADGHDFYEQQEAGVGDYFNRCLFEDIEALRSTAGVHSMRHGYHRAISDRFPYCIYYDIKNNSVLVRAVVDERRDPIWIRRKLKRL